MRIKKIIQAAVITLAAFVVLGCNPTKQVSRIISRHPDQFTNTIDTLYLPEVKIDTFFTMDTVNIKGDLDSIFIDISEPCKEEVKELIPSISHYIATRDIITDTLYYTSTIENDSLILNLNTKIWQDGTDIHLNVVLEDSKVKTKTIEINHITKEKTSFKEKLRVILFYLGVGALLIFLFRRLTK